MTVCKKCGKPIERVDRDVSVPDGKDTRYYKVGAWKHIERTDHNAVKEKQ